MSFLPRLRRLSEQSKSDGIAILLLALWPLIFFWPAALRQLVFTYGDILLFFHPTHLVYADALRELRLPLWEPKLLAGFPLFAEGQIGALYPLHPFLYGLLPIDIATNYDILLHVSWIAIGTYLLARTWGYRPASAGLAAFAFANGGFFHPRLQHMSVLATASWLPWLMWAWERREMAQTRSKRLLWFGLLALMSGIQLLGGHPQFAFSTALFMSLYVIVRWRRHPDENSRTETALGVTRGRARAALDWFAEYLDPLRLVPLGLAFGIGAGLAAVQLMPTFELAGFTDRAGGLDARFFNAFSLRPVHLLMLFHPFIQGNPWPTVSVEVIGYTGLLTLVLAAGAILVRRDRRIVFLVLVALLALFLGVGDQNIVYRSLRHLPLFNYFRVPSRFFYWYTFAAALLAGATFDYWLSRAREANWFGRTEKAIIGCLVVVVAIVLGLVPVLPVEAWLMVWTWLPLALAAVAIWIVNKARRGLLTRLSLAALVLGVTVVDLSLFGAVYAKTYNAMTPVADFYRRPESLEMLKGLSPEEGRVLTSLWVYPWQSVMRESLYPNIGLAYGVSNVIGYTPLLPRYATEYIESITAQMVNLMNVRYYLIPQLLAVTPEVEGDDVRDPFTLQPVNRDVALGPTRAAKLQVVSALAQSTDWSAGTVVAEIYLTTQDGDLLTLPIRVGIDTAEWAFERSDVRKVIQYPMPRVATSFPALSALPAESHIGHMFQSEYDLTEYGSPPVITGIYVYPRVSPGLVQIERMYLVAPDGETISVAHLAGRADHRLIYRSNDVAIYENPDRLPRAFIVHDARVTDDYAVGSLITSDEFRPREWVYIADGEPVRTGSAQRPDETVRIIEYKPERVVLSVQASADGYVVLADAWFPGWTARVDGVETPIRRADYVFRAVRVGPGDHQIEFTYLPQSLIMGGATSLASLLILAGILAAGWMTRAPSER